jgi:hypothetical protein
VTTTTQSNRPGQPKSGLYGWVYARRRRLATIGAILAAIVVAYVIGFELSRRDLADARQLVQQLQTESQRLKKQIVDQSAELVATKITLAAVQAKLNEIMPTKDTYNIIANQSLIVANGRMTVGLIGSPSNQNVNLNINGRQQLAISGDVINVPPNCSVRVQSFDMFKVTVTATCP